MNPFHLESNGSDCHLRLAGEVTIEHARELHAALHAAVPGATALHIDAAEVTRLDAAALQVLLAAVRAAAHAEIVGASGAWAQALGRFGLADSAFIPVRSP